VVPVQGRRFYLLLRCEESLIPDTYGDQQMEGSLSDKEVLEAVLVLAKHTSTYVPAYIIPALLTTVGISIFTRFFSPDEYGEYALVMAVTGIMITVLSGWISQSILRFFPEYGVSRALRGVARNTAVISLLTVLLFNGFAAIFYLCAWHILGAYRRFYVLAIVLASVGSLFTVFNTMFQATLIPKTFAKYKVFLALGQLLLQLMLVLLVKKDVEYLIVGSIIAYVVAIGLMIRELPMFQVIRHTERNGLVGFVSLFQRFFCYGFPMLGWIMASTVLSLSDRFVIQIFKGAAQVGIYASNYSLVDRGIAFVSAPLLMAAHPLIMNAWGRSDQDRIGTLISIFSRYFLLITIPVVFYFSVFGHEVVSILLGEGFRSGHVVVPIILVGLLAWHLSMYGHKGLEIMNKTYVMFCLVGICAIVNLGLNILFVPNYGYIAAAVSTSLSYLLYPFMVYFATKRHFKWLIPWRSIIRITVSSFITASFLAVLKFMVFGGSMNYIQLIIMSLCGMVIYLGLLCLLKEIRDYEVHYIKTYVAGKWRTFRRS